MILHFMVGDNLNITTSVQQYIQHDSTPFFLMIMMCVILLFCQYNNYLLYLSKKIPYMIF